MTIVVCMPVRYPPDPPLLVLLVAHPPGMDHVPLLCQVKQGVFVLVSAFSNVHEKGVMRMTITRSSVLVRMRGWIGIGVSR